MPKKRYPVFKLVQDIDGKLFSFGPPRDCSIQYMIGEETKTEDGSPLFALEDEEFARAYLADYLRYYKETYSSSCRTVRLFRATTTAIFPEQVHWIPIYDDGEAIRRFWREKQYRQQSGRSSLHIFKHTAFCQNLTITDEELAPLPERTFDAWMQLERNQKALLFPPARQQPPFMKSMQRS